VLWFWLLVDKRVFGGKFHSLVELSF